MLRAEDRRQRDAVRRRQAIDDVGEAAVDRRMVADDADALAAQASRVEQDVGSEANGGGGEDAMPPLSRFP